MTQIDDNFWKINLFTLGNSAVGKTSFILRFTKNSFNHNYLATIGIDFLVKNLKLPTGEHVKICFYDTAGQEQYKSISFNLIKGADGILLMYDITDKKSFESISNWIESIKEVKGDDFPIVLIGNKSDLIEQRVIKTEEGQKEADNNGFLFFETSSKDSINVEESVDAIVKKIIGKTNKQKENNIKLQKKKVEEKKTQCNC